MPVGSERADFSSDVERRQNDFALHRNVEEAAGRRLILNLGEPKIHFVHPRRQTVETVLTRVDPRGLIERIVARGRYCDSRRRDTGLLGCVTVLTGSIHTVGQPRYAAAIGIRATPG